MRELARIVAAPLIVALAFGVAVGGTIVGLYAAVGEHLINQRLHEASIRDRGEIKAEMVAERREMEAMRARVDANQAKIVRLLEAIKLPPR